MKVEFKEKSEDFLSEKVETGNGLKEIIVNYVGNRGKEESLSVTVDDIAKVMAHEFPEFLMAIAQENWIRGYTQALEDKNGVDGIMASDEENNKT